MDITIIGAGAFGCALAMAFERKGLSVSLVCESKNQADDLLKYRSIPSLPSVCLPKNICISATIINPNSLLVLAIPAQVIPSYAEFLSTHISPNSPILLASKGICEHSGRLMFEELSDRCHNPILVMSGPNFAQEISNNLLTVATLAGNDEALVKRFCEVLSSPQFIFEASLDPIGLQVCGSIKNVMAIGTGILVGLGEGFNAQAAFVQKALQEIEKWIIFYGGDPLTTKSSGGIGDFVLTCMGDLSRNRRFGLSIGRSETWSGELIEGYYTTRALSIKCQGNWSDFSITKMIYDILRHAQPPHMIKTIFK
jgi:glycerol-3-phosphate dehydrogenase (NAD(P)+)